MEFEIESSECEYGRCFLLLFSGYLKRKTAILILILVGDPVYELR